MLEHDPLRQPNRDWRLQSETEPVQSFQTVPFSDTASEAKIEDYLDKVFAPLVAVIPYGKRQELRAEIREHLKAMIAAHEELGSEPKEALEFALRQFGKPKTIASHWRIAWQESQRSFQPAFRYALRWFCISSALFCIHIPIVDKLQQGRDIPVAFTMIVYLIGPLLSGLATGWNKQVRPILAAFTAQAIASVGIGVFITFMEACLYDHRSMSLMEMIATFSFGFALGALMTPVAALGAGLGKFLRGGKGKALVR